MKKLYASTVMKNKHTTGTVNYYKIMDEKYGIEIVKKEYGKDEIKCEKNSVNKISTNESKIINIIEKLKSNKVTPIGLNDVLLDLLKQPQFQGE